MIADNVLSIDSASLTGDGSVFSHGTLSAKLLADYTQNINASFRSDGDATLMTVYRVRWGEVRTPTN